MPPLKATVAREINKTDITEAETLVFEGRVLKQIGKQNMEPGEFYFRPTVVPTTTQPGFWARLFGAKQRQGVKIVQTLVMACPYCSAPLMTAGNVIEHRAPLTIGGQITCPYSQGDPHSFKVVEGNIIAA